MPNTQDFDKLKYELLQSQLQTENAKRSLFVALYDVIRLGSSLLNELAKKERLM